jgi:hypothetical protein
VECLVECLVEWAAWVAWVEWVCNSRLSRLKNYKTPVVKHFGGFFYVCTINKRWMNFR